MISGLIYRFSTPRLTAAFPLDLAEQGRRLRDRQAELQLLVVGIAAFARCDLFRGNVLDGSAWRGATTTF
jgi:hypothetical protein